MGRKGSGAKGSRQGRELPVAGQPEDAESLLRASALDSAPSLAERLQAQREQLFKAISIVECCKNATATQLAVDDLEYMVPAFDTVYGLLNSAAGELEVVADACRALGRTVAGKSAGEPFDPEQDQD